MIVNQSWLHKPGSSQSSLENAFSFIFSRLLVENALLLSSNRVLLTDLNTFIQSSIFVKNMGFKKSIKLMKKSDKKIWLSSVHQFILIYLLEQCSSEIWVQQVQHIISSSLPSKHPISLFFLFLANSFLLLFLIVS